MNSFIFHYNPRRVTKAGTVARFILQVRGLRHREVESCAQGHIVSGWSSDPDSLVQSPCFPDPLLLCKCWDLIPVVRLQQTPSCPRQGAMPIFSESSLQILL